MSPSSSLSTWHSQASWKTQSRVKMPGVSRTQLFPWVSGCLFFSQPGKYITASTQDIKTPNLITKDPSLEFTFYLQNVASSFKEGSHQKQKKKTTVANLPLVPISQGIPLLEELLQPGDHHFRRLEPSLQKMRTVTSEVTEPLSKTKQETRSQKQKVLDL